MTYSERILEIGRKQAAMCNENSVAYINCLVTCEGMRNVMCMVYNVLTYTKSIPKIESIPTEEKHTLWEQTKEFAKDTLSLAETIRLSKALFALEYLIQ